MNLLLIILIVPVKCKKTTIFFIGVRIVEESYLLCQKTVLAVNVVMFLLISIIIA